MTLHIPYGNQVCFICNKEFVRCECIASKEDAGRYIEEHKSDIPTSPSKRITYEMKKTLEETPYQVYKCPHCGVLVHDTLDLLCAMYISAKRGAVSETIFGMMKEKEE